MKTEDRRQKTVNKLTSRTKSATKIHDDAPEIVERLLDAIRSHSPDFKTSIKPSEIEKMKNSWSRALSPKLRKGEISREGAISVIDYAHRHDTTGFWRQNILSARSLIKQYDRLLIASRQKKPKRSQVAEIDWSELDGMDPYAESMKIKSFTGAGQ